MDRDLGNILSEHHVELIDREKDCNGDDRGHYGCSIHLASEDQLTEDNNPLKRG